MALGHRVGHLFACTPLFSSAALVVHQHGQAGDFPQLPLDPVEVLAVVDADARRESDIGGVFVRVVGHHDHFLRALCRDLPGDVRNARAPFDRLPAGHGDSIIEQDLVGQGDIGGDRLTNRQNT